MPEFTNKDADWAYGKLKNLIQECMFLCHWEVLNRSGRINWGRANELLKEVALTNPVLHAAMVQIKGECAGRSYP